VPIQRVIGSSIAPDQQRNPKPGVFEMTKIALTAAALLVATGAAFAGSDHYNPNEANRPAASVDTSFTASIRTSDANVQKPAVQAPGQGLFGNR
jgi:hypothetical protein